MAVELVGYKRFESKGKKYCVANIARDFGRNAQDCYGKEVESIFIPSAQVDYLSPSDIGKSLELDYEISGTRAYLTNVTVMD